MSTTYTAGGYPTPGTTLQDAVEQYGEGLYTREDVLTIMVQNTFHGETATVSHTFHKDGTTYRQETLIAPAK